MTNNVENSRPGVLPTLVKGAAVGGLAGWGASKLAFKKPIYTSWDDLSREAVDSFKKMGDEAAVLLKGENGKFNEVVKTTRTGFTDEAKNIADAVAARKEQWGKSLAEVTEKIKSGSLKIEGFDAAKESAENIAAKAKEYIKKNLDADEALKPLKDAFSKVTGLRKDLAGKVGDSEAVKNAAESAWNATKDTVKGFKIPRTKAFIIGGALLTGLLALMFRPKAKQAQ